jgi:hypothetical protein
MSEQQVEKIPHKDGSPWTNVRVLASFNEADTLRKSLQQDTTHQVKIKKQTNSTGEEIFVVKTRKNPSLTLEEEPAREKKKNKKS